MLKFFRFGYLSFQKGEKRTNSTPNRALFPIFFGTPNRDPSKSLQGTSLDLRNDYDIINLVPSLSKTKN